MATKSPGVPFSSFLCAAIAGHLIFAIPAIIGILLFSLMDVKALFFILVPIALTSIPVSAAFAWLIAKGSNWVNTTAAITASSGVPGRIYGVLFGGILGFHFFSTAGGIILAILFYLFAFAATVPLGKFLSREVLSTRASQTEQSLHD